MFKINKNIRTKKKKIVSAFSRFKSINNPFLFKKYKTNKVYPKSNPFRPSIKFEPLISIKIQKEENKLKQYDNKYEKHENGMDVDTECEWIDNVKMDKSKFDRDQCTFKQFNLINVNYKQRKIIVENFGNVHDKYALLLQNKSNNRKRNYNNYKNQKRKYYHNKYNKNKRYQRKDF